MSIKNKKTLRQTVRRNFPENVKKYYLGGVKGCPYHYELEEKEDSEVNCKEKGGNGCKYCWSRKI